MNHLFDRTTVEGAARYFQNCIRTGDVNGALSSFDEEAIYITEPGKFVKGKEEIKEKLEFLCSIKPDLQALRSSQFTIGDIASWVDEWTLKATLPDGTPLNMTGISSDVMKKQKDGTWAYLVDNPYGADYLNH